MGVRFAPSLLDQVQRPSICVCVDSSASSRQAAQWACTMLRRGETMRLLTVTQPSAASQLLYQTAGAIPTDRPCDADPTDLRRARELLEERRQDCTEVGVSAARVQVAAVTSCLGTAQDIARRLLEEAEGCGCTMLVVGSRGLGVSERAVLSLVGLGSVSEHLVRTARVESVAVFRPTATGDWVTVEPSALPVDGSEGGA